MADSTWQSGEAAEVPRPRGVDWVRVFLRAVPLVLLLLGGLSLLLLVRLIERPTHGLHRPWTPHITVFVCRWAFRVLGIRYTAHGHRMNRPGAVVANHSSWLDIFALNAGERVYFVSKSEVANWPGIGWLAKATGTVFINRDRKEAGVQKQVFEDRLEAGHKLLFFPEGTSTDGSCVLPFKPTLFAAFFSERLRDLLWVQPVTVVYRAPDGRNPRFYCWWGDMDLGSHLLAVLAQKLQGEVEVFWHDPMKVSEFPDRKTLAKAAEAIVAADHPSSDQV